MRVGLNLLYAVPGRSGGTETYGVQLVRALAARDDGNEYVVFANARLNEGHIPAGIRLVRVKSIRSSGIVRLLWEQCFLARRAAALGVDVLHSLGYTGPLRCSCPAVLTVPDANVVRLAQYINPARRMALSVLIRTCARRAKAVIAISEFSRRELEECLGIPGAKIHVTPLGPGWDPDLETEHNGRPASQAPRPYSVAFSSPSPHKNIARLVEAFERVAPAISQDLVLIGAGSHQYVPTAPPMKSRIRAAGLLPSQERNRLVAGADFLVMPSLYEGFGLPVLEAQRAGVPVLCSVAGALPEVAGKAALFFDPLDVCDIARALREAATNGGLRSTLAREGRLNARRYSWPSTAELTARVYRKASES